MQGPFLSFVLLVSIGFSNPLWAQEAGPIDVDTSGTEPDSLQVVSDTIRALSGDSILSADTLFSDREETASGQIYRPPPQFVHDSYFQNYTSTFSSSMSATRGNLPGLMGLEGHGLSDDLPGIHFRRNGVPYQPGEFSWLGGDGQVLGISSDRTTWEAEPLGFPPWGAHDPVMMPGPSDSVFVVPVPLLDYAPTRLEFWRDSGLPDSALTEARHTNGPDGYSYTGGRFRTKAGSVGAFDGQFFRVFSNGNISNAAFDGHNLDIQFRRYVGSYPARVRFRQNRGERSNSFRWQSTSDRASHEFILSHFDVELEIPAGHGEWLLGWHIRHEEQSMSAIPLLGSPQGWRARRYSLSMSRLWQATLSGWLQLEGRWGDGKVGSSALVRRDLDVSGGVRVPYRNLDLTLTTGVRTVRGLSAEERMSAAVAFRVSHTDRLLAFAGFSKQHPSELRRWLPALSGGGGFSVAGNTGLDIMRHKTASFVWQHKDRRVELTALITTGKSEDLAVWQPSGDTATSSVAYLPGAIVRTYSGAGAVLQLRPWQALRLKGSLDRRWSSDSEDWVDPVLSPENSWSATAMLTLVFNDSTLFVTPVVNSRGSFSEARTQVYATLNAGVDVRLKQLQFYYHRENMLDQVYRTGGSAYAYFKHIRYGFRWEFWN